VVKLNSDPADVVLGQSKTVVVTLHGKNPGPKNALKKFMKSTLFTRPNLKLFLLGAALIAGLQHLISDGHSQAPAVVFAANVATARVVSEGELQRMIQQAAVRPSAQAYLRLSQCFEKRRDYKQAISYLRKAEACAQREEFNE
jgi:hypothetical protein